MITWLYYYTTTTNNNNSDYLVQGYNLLKYCIQAIHSNRCSARQEELDHVVGTLVSTTEIDKSILERGLDSRFLNLIFILKIRFIAAQF